MNLFRAIVKGALDQSVILHIKDDTTLQPEQAVDETTPGLSFWYRRDGGLVVTFGPASLGAANSPHADGGIEHLDDGSYRVDVPDAAFAIGTDGVLIGGSATGMIIEACYVPLWEFNPYVPVATIADMANANRIEMDTNSTRLSEIVEAETDPMTEAYAALGAEPTRNQILYEIRSMVAEKATLGTTMSAFKLDGTTVWGTFTLNHATQPTSIHRAT